MKEIQSEGIQEDVRKFVDQQGLEAPIETRLLDLVSEVGELSKEVLKATSYGTQPLQTVTEEFEYELADVLFSLTCIANTAGINLEVALRRALAKYGARVRQTGEAGSGQ